jgi:hypothetical protein
VKTRTLIATATVGAAALTAFIAMPAQAAPVNSPRISGTLFANCSGVGVVEVVSPPANDHANFTPGFVVGTHTVAVPYVFDFVISTGGTVVQHEHAAKAAIPKNAVRCTVDLGTFTVGGITYTGTGYVIVAVHGKP